jgi:hypothetical protein
MMASSRHRDAQNNDGKTPLHYAVEKENIDIIKLLLSYGANPNTPDNKGFSPLAAGLTANNKSINNIFQQIQIQNFDSTIMLKLSELFDKSAASLKFGDLNNALATIIQPAASNYFKLHSSGSNKNNQIKQFIKSFSPELFIKSEINYINTYIRRTQIRWDKLSVAMLLIQAIAKIIQFKNQLRSLHSTFLRRFKQMLECNNDKTDYSSMEKESLPLFNSYAERSVKWCDNTLQILSIAMKDRLSLDQDTTQQQFIGYCSRYYCENNIEFLLLESPDKFQQQERAGKQYIEGVNRLFYNNLFTQFQLLLAFKFPDDLNLYESGIEALRNCFDYALQYDFFSDSDKAKLELLSCAPLYNYYTGNLVCNSLYACIVGNNNNTNHTNIGHSNGSNSVGAQSLKECCKVIEAAIDEFVELLIRSYNINKKTAENNNETVPTINTEHMQPITKIVHQY